MIPVTSEQLPTGYRKAATSDLVLPEALAREREVWTKDERKLFERVNKLLKGRGLVLALSCRDARCQHEPLEAIQRRDGAVVLRCQHKDRILTRDF